MNAQRREILARQLETLREHANSVTRMTEEGADCIEVLHHLQEMRVALYKTKMELLEDYLEHWKAALIQGQDPIDCTRLLKGFPILFESAGKTRTQVADRPRRKSMIPVRSFPPSTNGCGCKGRTETWVSNVEGDQSARVNIPTKPGCHQSNLGKTGCQDGQREEVDLSLISRPHISLPKTTYSSPVEPHEYVVLFYNLGHRM